MRPQTVNQLCRRLVAEGAVERVGTRPILNRLPAPTPRRGRKTAAGKKARVEAAPEASLEAPPEATPEVTEPVLVEQDAPDTGAPPTPAPKPRRTRKKAEAAVAVEEPAPEVRSEPAPAEQDAPEVEASPTPDPPAATKPRRTRKKAGAAVAVEEPPAPEADRDGTAETNGAGPTVDRDAADVPAAAVEEEPAAEVEEAPATYDPPPYDALQAWSRVVNVQSLVAGWLVRRGATLRWASADVTGPALDLVASLDGDDVHVEVTGWPSDGARTHPTTIAGDWFSAAEHAATERRRAHPRARIVIALPDTRRYRSLTEARAASLDGARAEVWFVDAAGAVHAR
ncbi:hypothetical protein [Actinomycetospora aeridis]|uniref:MarR family transcriptional regulator n=1 Tax=Actinomycetospora aeridis TaxID=3129231 RepID=A0ABU8N915_9PSEU